MNLEFLNTTASFNSSFEDGYLIDTAPPKPLFAGVSLPLLSSATLLFSKVQEVNEGVEPSWATTAPPPLYCLEILFLKTQSIN